VRLAAPLARALKLISCTRSPASFFAGLLCSVPAGSGTRADVQPFRFHRPAARRSGMTMAAGNSPETLPMSTAATTTNPQSFDAFGYGLAIAGSVLFSAKGIFIKLAYGYGVSTEMLLSLRMLVALPVYLVILANLFRRSPDLPGRLSLRLVLVTMAVGILGYYISSYLDFLGLAFVSAQYERLVLFTYPFFVV